MVTQVEIELTRVATGKISSKYIVLVFYLIIGLSYVAWSQGWFGSEANALELNTQLIMGIPRPVWVWSIIGSLVSILIRTIHSQFVDLDEAIRWILFRPIVGLVMGVMTYLMLITGLIVFAGSAEAQSPELIWVIAFIGSFSDTLSINLLQGLIGKLRTGE